MENRQSIPTIEEIEKLDIKEELPKRISQFISFSSDENLFFLILILLSLFGLVYSPEFYDYTVWQKLNAHFFYFFLPIFMILFFYAIIFAGGNLLQKISLKLELRSTQNKDMAKYIIFLFLFVLALQLPSRLLEFNLDPTESDVASIIIIFTTFFIVSGIFGYSPFFRSFIKLKKFLIQISQTEKEEYFKTTKTNESRLRTGLKYLGEILRRDKIKLKVGFVEDYFKMLKWFGQREERDNFVISLFEILMEMKNLDEIKVGKILLTLKEKFDNLKERWKNIAGIELTSLQKSLSLIRDNLGPIIVSAFGTLITIIYSILTQMVFI